MMDLLVHVASECKLKPGEHVISVLSEDTGRPIEYQSSQTIGSISVSTIYLQNKDMQKKEREKEMQMHRDASKFEVWEYIVSFMNVLKCWLTCV